MSKFIGIIIGTIEVVVGVITGNPALIVSGALMIASNAAQLLLAPKADKPTRNASQTTLQLGEVPRAAIFGEVAVGGSLVDAFNYGGTYGTDWEVVIIALADHRCEGLTGFFVDDAYVAFTGDGAVSGYNGQLEVYFRNGSLVQTLPSVVTTQGGWAATDYGAGVCYVVVAYKADKPDAKNPVWPGGRPHFLWVVKGKRCYIARKDSTVPGGSGAHRWADPSTWEWTDNLIDCRYNWARGIYAGDQVGDLNQLLVGRGLSAAEQPPANTFAPANLCDELVGGEKRYRVDGSVNSGQKHLDVEEEFASACGGVIVTREGSVEIEPAQAKAPSFFFTDADLITGSTVDYNEGILSEADDSWVNTVVARYIEPNQKWKDHAAPVRRNTVDLIADGGPRLQSLTLDLVKRAIQAGVVAEVARRLGRLWGRGQVTLGPRFVEVEEGDWGQWTSDRRFGGATKTFRVESFKLGNDWQNTLQLREISSGAYASVDGLTDSSDDFLTATRPTLTAPGGLDWLFDVISITGSGEAVPALQLTGAVTQSGVDSVLFEYRLYSGGLGVDDNWVTAGIESRDITKKTIGQVSGLTSYQVSIRYRVSGELSPRRILGPQTAGAYGTASAPGDANRVRRSRFERDMVGWAISNAGASSLGTVGFVRDARSDRLKITGATFTGIGQSVKISNDLASAESRIPVTPGERIYVGADVEFDSLTGAPCNWTLQAAFTNTSAGVDIRSVTSGSADQFAEVGNFIIVPAGALYMALELIAGATGAGTFTMSLGRPMVCSAGSSQLAHPPFTPGPSNGLQDFATAFSLDALSSYSFPYTNAGAQSYTSSNVVARLKDQAGVAVASGLTWKYVVLAGTVNGNAAGATEYAMSVDGADAYIPVTSLGSNRNKVELRAYLGAIMWPKQVELVKDFASAPAPTGGTGSGSLSASSGIGAAINTTPQVVGSLSGTMPAGVTTANLSLNVTLSIFNQAVKTATSNVTIKLQRLVGATWTDLSGASGSGTCKMQNWEPIDGSITINFADTGLSASTAYQWRAVAFVTSGVDAVVSGNMTVTA